MKVALVWWWTWGHIFPLLSLYNYLNKEENLEFIWIWEINSLEEKIALQNNIKFYPIKSWKLRRYFSFKNFYEPFYNLVWFFQAIQIYRKEKIDVVFLKWWYVSIAATLWAKLLGKKILLHESDSVPWVSNRFASIFAKKIFLTFSWAKKYFNIKKTQVIGQILNPELFENIEVDEPKQRTQLLITGWSQGSSRIFEFILANAEVLVDFDITVILGTLNTIYKSRFDKFENIKALEFVDQKTFAKIYENTDIAITRAWATTLFELANFNILMFIVPLKESANNHQYYNSLDFAKRWNKVFLESEMSEKLLNTLIENIWYKKEKLINTEYLETLEIIKNEILNNN